MWVIFLIPNGTPNPTVEEWDRPNFPYVGEQTVRNGITYHVHSVEVINYPPEIRAYMREGAFHGN